MTVARFLTPMKASPVMECMERTKMVLTKMDLNPAPHRQEVIFVNNAHAYTLS